LLLNNQIQRDQPHNQAVHSLSFLKTWVLQLALTGGSSYHIHCLRVFRGKQLKLHGTIEELVTQRIRRLTNDSQQSFLVGGRSGVEPTWTHRSWGSLRCWLSHL